MITILFDLEIPIRPRKGIDGTNVTVSREMPFVPQIGMKIQVVADDEYREVEGVYWSPTEGLAVFLQFDEDAKLSRLKKLGWKEVL